MQSTNASQCYQGSDLFKSTEGQFLVLLRCKHYEQNTPKTCYDIAITKHGQTYTSTVYATFAYISGSPGRRLSPRRVDIAQLRKKNLP